MNYYNEFDLFVAQWLRNLIGAGLIPAGDVDERDIKEVRPDDLTSYAQCHFFAGIGGWSYALQLAGWPTDRPVWTGSCPCQPFSCAGKRKGIADARHLWPEFFRLIEECRPATVFDEQVASKDGLRWLDGVLADLERAGYACGASDLCAAGVGEEITIIAPDSICLSCGKNWDYCTCVLPGPFSEDTEVVLGAPHIRQRLYWVAYADGTGYEDTKGGPRSAEKARRMLPAATTLEHGAHQWIPEPDVDRVVHGVSACPPAVRAYGNAIVPQVAAEFIKTCMELIP